MITIGKREQLLSAFRQNGMKVTPQRRLLCQLIEEADDHPTVENLYERAIEHMPTMSLKTVYTTLTDLSSLGSIRLSSMGSSHLRVDPDPSPHAHLVCKSCDRVIDIPIPAMIDRLTSYVDRPGFTIEEQEVIFRGRCQRCTAADGFNAKYLKDDEARNPNRKDESYGHT